MKTIQYRGGLISFNIPKNWVEEYVESGGGTFYEDIPTSGTLRVNVMTIAHESPNVNPGDMFKEKHETNELKEYLSDSGDEIYEHIIRTEENRIPITLFHFTCVHKTEQKDFLLAMFTWTIETIFEYDEDQIQEINAIRNCICGVKFGR